MGRVARDPAGATRDREARCLGQRLSQDRVPTVPIRRLVQQAREVTRDELLVRGIDDELVERLLEEHPQVRGVELVQWIVTRVVQDECVGVPVPASTPDALPCRHHAVGEAREDHPVEAADVYAEFKRVRGERETHRAVTNPS